LVNVAVRKSTPPTLRLVFGATDIAGTVDLLF